MITDPAYEFKNTFEGADRIENIIFEIGYLLATQFPTKINVYMGRIFEYLKDPEESIRAAAILLFGTFNKISDLNKYGISDMQRDEILAKGLFDKSPKVRIKALKSYSFLSNLHKNLK